MKCNYKRSYSEALNKKWEQHDNYNTSCKLILTKETYFDLKQKGEIKL